MKKRLNTDAIANELRGGSAFFPDYEAGNAAEPGPADTGTTERQRSPRPAKVPSVPTEQLHKPEPARIPQEKKQEASQHPQAHDTMIPRHHDTMVSRNHGTMVPVSNDAIFEVVRKAVKQIGKEAATHRFTIDEKNQLADIEYTYKRRGIKTSENEITRIAINYFTEDYRLNGEESLLAKILAKLNS
jgi:hypothetical protein